MLNIQTDYSLSDICERHTPECGPLQYRVQDLMVVGVRPCVTLGTTTGEKPKTSPGTSFSVAPLLFWERDFSVVRSQ